MHKIGIDLSKSPLNSPERTQLAIDFVGELIFRIRDEAIESNARLLKDASHRKSLGTVISQPFDVLSSLSGEELEAVLKVCEQSVDSFAKLLLAFIDHQGSQLRFADNRIANFVLLMQVLNFKTREVEEEHLMNRTEGAKFSLRWGRWLLNHLKNRKNNAAP